MRILYAALAYKPAWRIGGPVLSVSAAAEHLVAKGHEVTVFTSNSNLDQDLDVETGRPIDVNGVQVWYFRHVEPIQKLLPFVPYLSRSVGYLYCPGMKRALDTIMPGIDVVDTQSPFIYPTYAAAHAAFRHGKPLFYHQRGSFGSAHLRFRSLKKRVYIAAIEKPIMRRAHRLIALTETERVSFDALNVSRPIDVIPNGVDVPPEEVMEPGFRSRAGARWGIPQDAVVVLFLGRLHPFKGAEKLLDAFVQVASRREDVWLILAGPDEWGVQESWKAKLSDSGVAGRVVFTGMIMGPEKTDALARADLFCLPSSGEGLSMAILEAMASGTAVLISPECNFDEVGTLGAGLVRPSDRQSMYAALIEMLNAPDRLADMGARGRNLVMESYSWEVVARQLISSYESAVEGSGGSGSGRFSDDGRWI